MKLPCTNIRLTELPHVGGKRVFVSVRPFHVHVAVPNSAILHLLSELHPRADFTLCPLPTFLSSGASVAQLEGLWCMLHI